MFCNKCGHQMKEGHAFCEKCGKAVVVREASQQPAPDNEAQVLRQTAVDQPVQLEELTGEAWPPVPEAPDTRGGVIAEKVQYDAPFPPPKKKGNKKIIIALVAIIGVVIIAFVGLNFLGGSDDAPPPPSNVGGNDTTSPPAGNGDDDLGDGTDSGTDSDTPSPADVYFVTAYDNSRVLVRSQPTRESDALLTIEAGDTSVRLKSLDESYYDGEHSWHKVQLPDGRTGWGREDVIVLEGQRQSGL